MIDDPLDDPLNVYVREIGSIAPLSREEEIACIQHLRAGDQESELAAKRLFEANLPLVVSIAMRSRRDDIYILDLIVRGNEGLQLALQSFDANCGESFSAHALSYIERAIAGEQ